jgi:hypothetical protein
MHKRYHNRKIWALIARPWPLGMLLGPSRSYPWACPLLPGIPLTSGPRTVPTSLAVEYWPITCAILFLCVLSMCGPLHRQRPDHIPVRRAQACSLPPRPDRFATSRFLPCTHCITRFYFYDFIFLLLLWAVGELSGPVAPAEPGSALSECTCGVHIRQEPVPVVDLPIPVPLVFFSSFLPCLHRYGVSVLCGLKAPTLPPLLGVAIGPSAACLLFLIRHVVCRTVPDWFTLCYTGVLRARRCLQTCVRHAPDQIRP